MAPDQPDEKNRSHPDLYNMRKVIPSIAVPVAVFDLDLKVILVNDAMRELFQVENFDDGFVAVMRNLNIRSLDNQPVQDDEFPFDKALEGDVIQNRLYRITWADGDERLLEVDLAPIPLEGKIYGGIFFARDVTEREKTRVRAIDRAAELDATLVSAAESLIMYDREGHIVRMNERARRIFPYPEETWGQSIEEQMKGDIRIETMGHKPFPPERHPVARALRGEVVEGEAMAVIHADGTTFWLLGGAAPIRKSEHEMQGVVATFTNISKIHILEQQREMYLDTVSHDLRTPITAIRGFAEALQEDLKELGGDNDIDGYVQAILNNAKQIQQMITDMSDVVKLESLLYRAHRERVNLPEFFDEFRKNKKAALDLNRLRLDIPKDLPGVCGDPDALTRIVTNLLSNALKFSAEETEVQVRAEATDEEVVVSVQDFGVGLSPKEQENLFQGRRASRRTREGQGIGLGLYISRMLVEAQGGRIWAESAQDQGSTFRFSIPTFGCA